MPQETSLFSVSANNVIISTVKKCEDDDLVVARMCGNCDLAVQVSVANTTVPI